MTTPSPHEQALAGLDRLIAWSESSPATTGPSPEDLRRRFSSSEGIDIETLRRDAELVRSAAMLSAQTHTDHMRRCADLTRVWPDRMGDLAADGLAAHARHVAAQVDALADASAALTEAVIGMTAVLDAKYAAVQLVTNDMPDIDTPDAAMSPEQLTACIEVIAAISDEAGGSVAEIVEILTDALAVAGQSGHYCRRSSFVPPVTGSAYSTSLESHNDPLVVGFRSSVPVGAENDSSELYGAVITGDDALEADRDHAECLAANAVVGSAGPTTARGPSGSGQGNQSGTVEAREASPRLSAAGRPLSEEADMAVSGSAGGPDGEGVGRGGEYEPDDSRAASALTGNE